MLNFVGQTNGVKPLFGILERTMQEELLFWYNDHLVIKHVLWADKGRAVVINVHGEYSHLVNLHMYMSLLVVWILFMQTKKFFSVRFIALF